MRWSRDSVDCLKEARGEGPLRILRKVAAHARIEFKDRQLSLASSISTTPSELVVDVAHTAVADEQPLEDGAVLRAQPHVAYAQLLVLLARRPNVLVTIVRVLDGETVVNRAVNDQEPSSPSVVCSAGGCGPWTTPPIDLAGVAAFSG